MSWLELLFTLNLGRCSLENFKCLNEKRTFTLVLSWLHMDVMCSSYNMTNEWLSYRYVGVIKPEGYFIHTGIEMCRLPSRKWHLWRFFVSKYPIGAFSFLLISSFLFLTFFLIFTLHVLCVYNMASSFVFFVGFLSVSTSECLSLYLFHVPFLGIFSACFVLLQCIVLLKNLIVYFIILLLSFRSKFCF